MNVLEINSAIQYIEDFLKKKVDVSVPADVIERLNDAANMLGLSAELCATTEQIYNKKFAELCDKYPNVNITKLKIIAGGELTDEYFNMNYCEKLNKELHYTIESLRSIISYLKEEYKQINLNN
jgi:hypothetical protein